MRLPDFLIADLYKNTLVDLTPTSNTKTGKQKPVKEHLPAAVLPAHAGQRLKFLGENKRHISLIVNQPDAVHLQEDELNFLATILKACSLTLADVAIINIAGQPVVYSLLQEELQPAQVLLFGSAPSEIKIPFNIPHFQVQQYGDCSVMTAPALSQLNTPAEEAKALKSKLWIGLKKLLEIA